MFKGKKIDVYVARDSLDSNVDIYPASIGIRKFHGCIAWGAAWNADDADLQLYPIREAWAESLEKKECKEIFGFYPKPGTAYLVEHLKTKMRITKVDIDFSNEKDD